MDQPFTALARAESSAWTLSRPAFDRMMVAEPHLCILVQTALLKSLALFDAQFLTDKQH